MAYLTLARRIINLLRDIVFLYMFLNRSSGRNKSTKHPIPAFAAILAMLAMFTAEDGGIFANPWIRFMYRWLCCWAFVRFSGTKDSRIALYVSLLGDIHVVLIHNVFLTPLTRPLVLGTQVFTGNAVADIILSFVIVSAVTCLYYFFIYKLMKIEEIDEVNISRVLLASLTSVSCIYLNEQLRMVTDANISVVSSFSISTVILEFALMACIIFMEQLQHTYKERMDEKIRRVSSQALLDSVREQEAGNEKMRQLRHDIRNHLNSIGYLVETGNNTQASRYIEDLLGTYTKPVLRAHTGNALLDGIISSKLAEANKKGIPFEVSADCGRIGNIDDIDLCTIFGNAIDNAIEAVSRQPEEEDRFVSLKTQKKAGLLVIVIRNTFSGTLQPEGNGFFHTSKTDGDEHGIGLRNIRRTVRRYNGGFSTSADEDTHVFRTVITLPMDKSSGQ